MHCSDMDCRICGPSRHAALIASPSRPCRADTSLAEANPLTRGSVLVVAPCECGDPSHVFTHVIAGNGWTKVD